MAKRRLFILTLTFIFLMLGVIFPAAAQERDFCDQFVEEARILLQKAQEALDNGQFIEAQAFASGARALIAQCLPAETGSVETPSSAVSLLELGQGFGAEKGFWQVYFTAPTGSRDAATYVGGVDFVIVDAINNTQRTLDIAAFEWNVPSLTEAVVNAAERGVRVRMVVDNEHTMEDEDSTIEEVIDAGADVYDDGRSGLMHNKFMIMDSTVVWTGSMNYTINDIYRNNNNALRLVSPDAVEAYQTEFNEMFALGEFGSKRSEQNNVAFELDGTPVQILFATEDPVVPAMVEALSTAQESIRFMTFSFTLDEVGALLLEKSEAGVDVQGIFETRGSRTASSELPLLFCAELPIREDGNPYTFHHKVFVIDEEIVVTGSFNISDSATNNNDENMLIIRDKDLAAQYIAEFDRVWAQAQLPPEDDITCP